MTRGLHPLESETHIAVTWIVDGLLVDGAITVETYVSIWSIQDSSEEAQLGGILHDASS